MTRRANVPDLHAVPASLKAVLEPIKDIVERLEGTKGDKAERAVKQGDMAESWQTPQLLNGWLRYDETVEQPGFYRDAASRVFLRGVVKSGTVATTIFTLPSGYRPGKAQMFAVITSTGVGRMDVKSDGTVVLVSGGNGYANLDGLSFRVT